MHMTKLNLKKVLNHLKNFFLNFTELLSQMTLSMTDYSIIQYSKEYEQNTKK